MPSGVFLGKKGGLRGYLLPKKELNRIYLEVFITSVLGVLGNGFCCVCGVFLA